MQNVHWMSLSSIHEHYNHDPVQAQVCTQRACTPLAIFQWPEVVRTSIRTVRAKSIVVPVGALWRL